MPAQLARDTFQTVEVFDPYRQRSVLLEGLKPSATMAEIKSRAMSELTLSGDVGWSVRHHASGRLLQDSDRLDSLTGDESQIGTAVGLVMQPDAGLGFGR